MQDQSPTILPSISKVKLEEGLLKTYGLLKSRRRCGSVVLGVVVLSVCEVCYVCEGYVGSAVVLCV